MILGPNGRKALVLSPSATHPQDYGNRNRVFQTTSFFKEMGYEIHFVLYPYESDWNESVPGSATEMRRVWDSFTVIPPSKPPHMGPAGEHHEIDEWWDPQIGSYLEWLFAREAFDVFVVNYTFFSKAFDYAPRRTIKILETHDIFSGRKELFLSHGAAPEFFYTTADQEKIALDRADIVVAIKDAEADILRRMTDREVLSIPFNVVDRPVVRRPERLERTEPLKIGFVGALNTVNVLNMARFLEKFAKYERIYVPPPMEIRIAGNVCSKLSAASPSVTLLGHVDSIEAYYEDIDVVVAPMTFSTGMKIKVGEALSFGKPVVSTQNGFDGFPVMDEFHSLGSVEAVCRALIKLAFDRDRLKLLETRSALAAQLARRRSLSGYDVLSRAVRRLTKGIIFVTDQPFAKEETLRQVRLSQWAEYCSHLVRTAVVYLGNDPFPDLAKSASSARRFAAIVDTDGRIDVARSAIRELSRHLHPIEIVVSAAEQTSQAIMESEEALHIPITLDLWSVPGAWDGTHAGDIQLVDRSAGPDGPSPVLSVTGLRYLPEALRHWTGAAPSDEVLVVLCDPSEIDLMGLALLEARTMVPVVAVEAFLDPDSGPDLLPQLSGRKAPRLLLAIGSDARIAETCRSLAAYAGVAFLHASWAHFPIAMLSSRGEPVLCHTYADIADQLADLGTSGPSGAPEQAGDTGWSAYWRELSLR